MRIAGQRIVGDVVILDLEGRADVIGCTDEGLEPVGVLATLPPAVQPVPFQASSKTPRLPRRDVDVAFICDTLHNHQELLRGYK